MKYLKLSITLIIMLANSCEKAGIHKEKSGNNFQKGETRVLLELQSDLTTKSGVLPEAFKNIHIFVFDKNGLLITHTYKTTFSDLTAKANYGTNHFAIIINAGDTEQFNIDSLPQLMNLVQEEKYGTDGNMTFSGKTTCNITPEYKRADVYLFRTMAKFTFVFDKSQLDPGVTIDITRIQLRNIPETTFLFKYNIPVNGQFQTYGPYLRYNNLEPSSHDNATPLYMHENLQGYIGNNTQPAKKHPGEQQNVCSFVLLKADYNSPGQSGSVEYIHYPGSNNTNNFDIKRNYHYKETIYFCGDGLSEAIRTDSSSLQKRSYNITVVANPPEGGDVSGGGTYYYEDLPLLHAQPAQDYTFCGWTPEISTVTSDQLYTANFAYTEPEPEIVYVSEIIINLPDSTETGSTVAATATLLPANATDKTVTWQSSQSSVASINNTGTITAVSPGTTTISATANDGSLVYDSKALIIYQPAPQIVPVTGITISHTTLDMISGETILISASAEPQNATNRSISWNSSNAGIATVNSNTGQINAVSPGTAIITATTEDGLYSVNCIVNVFDHINIEPLTHIIYQYDSQTNLITQADIIVYLRADVPAPSDMAIINAISNHISVDVTYSYTINGNMIYGFGTLTTDPVQNNDYPWIRIGGNTILITISPPLNQQEITEAAESLLISPVHGSIYIQDWYLTW